MIFIDINRSLKSNVLQFIMDINKVGLQKKFEPCKILVFQKKIIFIMLHVRHDVENLMCVI